MKKITQGVNGKLTAFRSASPKANYFGNFIEKKKSVSRCASGSSVENLFMFTSEFSCHISNGFLN